MREIRIDFTFRWPVKQVGENEVQVVVPVDKASTPILNAEICRELQLTDVEVDKAHVAMLRSIAVIGG